MTGLRRWSKTTTCHARSTTRRATLCSWTRTSSRRCSSRPRVQLAKLDGNPDIPVTEHPLYQQAKAQVDEAQRQLDHASVRAPFSGIVTQVDALQPGTYLVSQTAALTGTGAIALVSTDRVWITAQMKETDLTYVKPGNHVDVTVDTYPGQV